MEIEGNKERTVLAMAFARMWQDPQYKQEFVSDPKTVLSREGVNFSADTSVRVVEETRNITYVDLEKEELDLLRRLTPISGGHEVRIVQSTANLRYLVLPATPAWIAPGAQTMGNLLDAQTKESSVEAVIDSQSVVVQAISVSPIVEQSIDVESMELVVVDSQVAEVMDAQAIEVAQVEVETSVAESVFMA